jgi:phospholipid/cholesterol/gamma-HCH transport system ATP-binding protein
MTTTAPLFEVRGLVKSYGGKLVLDGLDFDLLRGECFVILGRSGSGKSVTLRQLTGLEQPDAGSIRFDGVEVTALSERELFKVRRRVAMLFQGGALFDSMNVFDNLAFPLREHTDFSPERIAERVRELLEQVHLPGIEEKWPADLSGGMKKRVALARAIALEPEAMLYDEPTTGLDPMTSAAISHLILRTQERLGVTSLVVTHDIAMTRVIADRIGFLDQGRFRFVGTLDEADASGDRLLADFLAGREEEENHVA